MTEIARLRAFLRLGRPHFLLGGLLLFALGSVLATAQGADIDWQRYIWGQAVITGAQWMTHYSNDYFDLDADRANSTPTRWSGGSRVLVSGVVAPRSALMASVVLGTAALLAACVLAARPDSPPLVLPLSLLIIVLSWCYSAPPLRLLSRGLGEVTTAVVVTLLTPLLGFYVQSSSVSLVLFLGCFPLCCLQLNMLLTIELPDAAGDGAQCKRTLVVRRGAEWAARCCAVLLVVAFGSLPLLVLMGLPQRIAILAALPAPLGLWQAIRLSRGAFREPSNWETLTLCSVALLVTTTVAELIAAADGRALGLVQGPRGTRRTPLPSHVARFGGLLDEGVRYARTRARPTAFQALGRQIAPQLAKDVAAPAADVTGARAHASVFASDGELQTVVAARDQSRARLHFGPAAHSRVTQ